MGRQQNIQISPIRAYYNDNDKQNSDWDQVLPISVFDAVYETSDPGSENLTQLKQSINTRFDHLFALLENQIPAGGKVGDVLAMTSTGPQWRSLEEMIDEIGDQHTYEDMPLGIINFENETIINLKSGSHSINGEIHVSDGINDLVIDPSWFGTTLYIIKKSTGENILDSIAQILSIPVKPSIPDVSSEPNTGTITGVDNNMEYRLLGGEWRDVLGSVLAGLTTGTYEVRVKVIPDTSFGSDIKTVDVTEEEGWELTYDYTGDNTVITTGNGRLTLSTWTGYNGQVLDENILYDAGLQSMDDIKVRLYAKLITDAEFKEVYFDNFGNGVSEPNKVQRWGYVGIGDGYIQIIGSNSTGVNIQLKLIKEV